MAMVFVLNEQTGRLELKKPESSLLVEQHANKLNDLVALTESNKRKTDSKFYQSGMQVLSPPPALLPFNVPLFITGYTAAKAIVPELAMAASKTPISDALWPIVDLLRDMALPVGIGVSIYGIIEYMLDNPNGKNRIRSAFIGYLGVFIIPLIFRAIQQAFTNTQ